MRSERAVCSYRLRAPDPGPVRDRVPEIHPGPCECEDERGRAGRSRTAVLDVRRDGASKEGGDEKEPERPRPRDSERHCAGELQNTYDRDPRPAKAERRELIRERW